MSKLVQKIPFLRLALSFVAGIVLASLVKIPHLFSAIISLGILISLILINQKFKYKHALIFGIGVHLMFLSLGASVFDLYNKKPEFHKKGKFVATVLEEPVEKENSYKSLLRLKDVKIKDTVYQTTEKILVYFSKSKKVENLKPGDIILFRTIPQPIKNNGNPYEFDYRKYLGRKKIYRQVYLPSEDWIKTSFQHSFSLKIAAEKTRMELLKIYRRQHLGENELNILSALTLGYKRELDPETKKVFASAGAMHILAVSGLHVGIIYLILSFLLGFLCKQKTGKLLFVMIVVSALWFFAFLTGLSPSVSRAATMFTFFVVGNNLNRHVNVYNSLAGSALFLLLVNPNNLFEVGFQLSYAAVFGIIYLQPKFENLLTINYKIPFYFWRLFTVSVAAQIATFPFSVLYFNQFPVYFWITNLFIIPAAFVLIPLGIALLIFNIIPLISQAISFLLDTVIGFVYKILETIDQLPFAVREVSVSIPEFIFIIGFIVSIFLFLSQFQKLYIKTALISLLLLFVTAFLLKVYQRRSNELIVYNSSDNSIVHVISGKKNYVVSEKKLYETDYDLNLVKNTITKLRLDPPTLLTKKDSFKDDIFLLKDGMLAIGNKVFVLGKNASNFPENFNPEVIINPPKKDLTEVNKPIESLIVSNKTFSPEVTKTGMKIYSLKKHGAYIKKW